MIKDPSWPLAMACAVFLGALAFLPRPLIVLGSIASSVGILCLNTRFRAALANWASAAAAIVCIALVLAASTAHAGRYTALILNFQALRLGRLLLGLLVGTVIVVYWEPKAMLVTLDRMHVPRSVTYILLASMDSFNRVRRLGERQIALLSLKALNNGIGARFRSYYRIVLPMMVVMLKRQLAHAESLDQRGFFEKPRKLQRIRYSSHMWSLPVALFANGLFWWLACLWW
jgi:hypothetical protein